MQAARQHLKTVLSHDAVLMGMFTAHLTDKLPPGVDDDGIVQRFGVGTVLPIETIEEFIMNDTDFKATRATRDAEMEAAEDESPFTLGYRLPAGTALWP